MHRHGDRGGYRADLARLRIHVSLGQGVDALAVGVLRDS